MGEQVLGGGYLLLFQVEFLKLSAGEVEYQAILKVENRTLVVGEANDVDRSSREFYFAPHVECFLVGSGVLH